MLCIKTQSPKYATSGDPPLLLSMRCTDVLIRSGVLPFTVTFNVVYCVLTGATVTRITTDQTGAEGGKTPDSSMSIAAAKPSYALQQAP